MLREVTQVLHMPSSEASKLSKLGLAALEEGLHDSPSDGCEQAAPTCPDRVALGFAALVHASLSLFVEELPTTDHIKLFNRPFFNDVTSVCDINNRHL